MTDKTARNVVSLAGVEIPAGEWLRKLYGVLCTQSLADALHGGYSLACELGGVSY